MRHKYRTYGHPRTGAMETPLEEIDRNLHFGVLCLKHLPVAEGTRHRLKGGFDDLKPNVPLYFLDAEYRRRRHQLMKEHLLNDEQAMRDAALPKRNSSTT